MAERDQLEVPPIAKQDRESFEVLRVWVANKGQHVSLKMGMWEDPAAWGILLSDLMNHIANAYFQEKGFDRSRTLQRIKAGLSAELGSPTDRPSGRIG